MHLAYVNSPDLSFFSDAQEQLEQIIAQLQSEHCASSEHGEIEQYIDQQGQELLRRLLQGFLDLKAANEPQQPFIMSSEGDELNHVRSQTTRKMTSLFGDVTVTRKRYSQRGQPSQCPLDAALNLAGDRYSDGSRHRIAQEAIRGSFDNAIEALDTTTGSHVPKRQSLRLVQDVAQDFDTFYQQHRLERQEDTPDLLVLTFDGKGIVMRPDSLWPCTQKAAQKNHKLKSRLSAGEKKDRKRMAQVAAVYTTRPHVRTAESIMTPLDAHDNVRPLRVPPRNKRVWASVERESESVIEEAFEEALARDPKQQRRWVVLVDGHPHQLKLIKRVMRRLHVEATVVMDFIHVLEYLWKAAWCFFAKGDEAVEAWVAERAIKILNGQCAQVAKGIRLSATRRGISKRENVDKCADYLLKNRCRLQYGEALAARLPIASGVIEGACRHLINDRLDITGARWGLQGAEAVLKLRSLKSSGDFDAYWAFHKRQSKERLYGELIRQNSEIS